MITNISNEFGLLNDVRGLIETIIPRLNSVSVSQNFYMTYIPLSNAITIPVKNKVISYIAEVYQ